MVRSGAIKTALDAKASTADLTSGLASKAGLASPAFTETPSAPTAQKGTNTTQVATTAFVQEALIKSVFLTQTQYDALGTAVKNNGDSYFIYEEV